MFDALSNALRSLPERGRALRDAARDAPENMRVSARFSAHSGLLWSLTRGGVGAMVRAGLSGSQNPSLIYRIHAKNSPSKPAVVFRGRATSWAELDARIDRLASSLVRRGVGRRERVLIMMRNRPEMIELGAAAARVGAGAVSVSWRTTAAELEYLANHSGARGIAIDQELYPVLDQARHALSAELLQNVFVVGDAPKGATSLDRLYDEEPARFDDASLDDDASVVIYTSGTTGKPKGAVRKFPKDTIRSILRFVNETPLRVDDVHIVACPLYHSTAFGFLSISHILGNTAVVMDEFKPEAFLELVDRHRASTSAMVPTMLHRILELPEETRRKYDTTTLRALFSGGAPLSGPLASEFMDAFGDVVFNFYGATETGLVTLAKPDDLRAAPGTIGRAVPGNDIRLLDDNGRPVGQGEAGELFVKNPMLVAGYHGDEDATQKSMREGYFSVGDLARCDRDGRYFIEGRKRDMIITGGVNVYPAEVEAALEAHADVAESAVVGLPDREWGERVAAFVVARQGATLDEGSLKAHARERLSGPKVPRQFVVLEALPRNPTGKVLKRDLRAMYGQPA
jgi:fatty-acyl-CoA synthase